MKKACSVLLQHSSVELCYFPRFERIFVVSWFLLFREHHSGHGKTFWKGLIEVNLEWLKFFSNNAWQFCYRTSAVPTKNFCAVWICVMKHYVCIQNSFRCVKMKFYDHRDVICVLYAVYVSIWLDWSEHLRNIRLFFFCSLTPPVDATFFTESAVNLKKLYDLYYETIIRDIEYMDTLGSRCDRN